jgi:hypothetical protein
MLPTRLLWDPLPDPRPVPARRRVRRLRDLGAAICTNIPRPRSPSQELVDQRVRRGAVQALVREAYQAIIAEQDSAHRGPGAFAQAWRDRLAGLLSQPEVDLHGWGPVLIAELDTGFAWQLYQAASQGRADAIAQAAATPSRPVHRGQRVPTYQFEIASGGATLGQIIYGICGPCHAGLLYKISFAPDWQFCGFGRLALSQLETRHPDLAWYTTGQLSQARGFYDRYRQHSSSPWAASQHPCPHFG